MSLVGELAVPGDKSVTHRALLLGAVAEGTTDVTGALDAADTRSTAALVSALGADVAWDGQHVAVAGTDEVASPGGPLDCGNAGTAARLLCGLLAGRPGRWTLDGDASLRSRPMSRVTEPLRAAGARIEGDALPLTVHGSDLAGVRHEVPVPSAQVKSALLLAGLTARGPTTVVQHVPTRDHTERMLRAFGIGLDEEPGAVTIHPGRPRAMAVSVPGDPSSAAFPVVAALLLPGSDLWLRHVGLWPRRTGFLRALERAGADLMIMRREDGAGSDPVGDIRVRAGELSAFDIEPADVPDLVDEVPILALAAARARGVSRFSGLAELRLKESDRISAVAALLGVMGVPVTMGPDSLEITGVQVLVPPDPSGSADHRMAMTAAVASLVCGHPVADVPAAEISFPGFAPLMASVTAS